MKLLASIKLTTCAYRGDSLADKVLHACRRHTAVSDEHNHNRIATETLNRKCLSLYSGLLDLQSGINSVRWTIV